MWIKEKSSWILREKLSISIHTCERIFLIFFFFSFLIISPAEKKIFFWNNLLTRDRKSGEKRYTFARDTEKKIFILIFFFFLKKAMKKIFFYSIFIFSFSLFNFFWNKRHWKISKDVNILMKKWMKFLKKEGIKWNWSIFEDNLFILLCGCVMLSDLNKFVNLKPSLPRQCTNFFLCFYRKIQKM